MLKNYLKIAWRNLAKNKVFSFINILGLAVGMTFAMVIGLWVKYELSFDNFHENGNRIAMLKQNWSFNDEKGTMDNMPVPLYSELKEGYPEIKHISRTDFGSDHGLKVGESKFSYEGRFVDPDFLKMFSFNLLEGNIDEALQAPYSIILSATAAHALFGNEEVIGQTVKIDNQHDLTVTGIIEDVPANSTYQFDFLVPYEYLVNTSDFVKNNLNSWSNNFISIVVEINENVSMDTFSDKVKFVAQQKGDNQYAGTIFLHPLEKLHLYNEFKEWKVAGGRGVYVSLFTIVGLIILMIACINFMNLSTARSEKRAKEVGIRKAIGSQRLQLIKQFLSESLLTSLLAFILSLLLLKVILPFVSELGLENVSFDYTDLALLSATFMVCVFTGLFAGSYPALYLSSFSPIKVLKSQIGLGKNSGTPRKILVTLQFTFSIALIICTVVIYQQIQHGKDRPIGYNPNNLLSIPVTADLRKNYDVLKQELLNAGMVEAVSTSSTPLTNLYDIWGDFSWSGKDPEKNVAFGAIVAGEDFDQMAGLKLKEGRFFNKDYSMNSSGMVLNESAVELIGFKNPIGEKMSLGGQDFTVIGVVKDVVMLNAFGSVLPTAIIYNSGNPDFIRNIGVRIKSTANLEKAMATIQPIFEDLNPAFPFEYQFVDQQVENKFNYEKQVGKTSGLFAVLAIFISCLGLFGLAAYLTESRTKEIGIRKVMGATVINLWTLLSKDFVILVLIACLIGSPIALWLMKDWLEKYDYRIEIALWMPLIACCFALIIVLMTVSAQTVRAAGINPTKSLKEE